MKKEKNYEIKKIKSKRRKRKEDSLKQIEHLRVNGPFKTTKYRFNTSD